MKERDGKHYQNMSAEGRNQKNKAKLWKHKLKINEKSLYILSYSNSSFVVKTAVGIGNSLFDFNAN